MNDIYIYITKQVANADVNELKLSGSGVNRRFPNSSSNTAAERQRPRFAQVLMVAFKHTVSNRSWERQACWRSSKAIVQRASILKKIKSN